MQKSITSRRRNKPANAKPEKPYDGYPLFAHASGRWAKKIRQRTHFFGRWGHKSGDQIVPVEDVPASAAAALEEFNRQWPYLSQGKMPPPLVDSADAYTLHDLVDDYLKAKRDVLHAGEITPRTFGEYYSTCERVVGTFGLERIVTDLTPEDFGRLRAKLAKTRGPVALGNEIQRVRMLFKWGCDQGKIDRRILYGQSFNKPSAKVIRKARAESGSRMFEAAELRTILDALAGKPVTVEDVDEPVILTADPVLRAMVLVAINCAYGQWDVACLPQTSLDLERAWSSFARPKTGVPRRAKLWDETVAAIKGALATRPTPKNTADAGLVFLTARGKRWVEMSANADPAKWKSRSDRLGKRFSAVLDRLGINGRRGFYAIRHSHQTAAEGCRDFPAIQYVMGHADASMSGVYRERIEDDRLEAVAATVHAWLFAPVSQ